MTEGAIPDSRPQPSGGSSGRTALPPSQKRSSFLPSSFPLLITFQTLPTLYATTLLALHRPRRHYLIHQTLCAKGITQTSQLQTQWQTTSQRRATKVRSHSLRDRIRLLQLLNVPLGVIASCARALPRRNLVRASWSSRLLSQLIGSASQRASMRYPHAGYAG